MGTENVPFENFPDKDANDIFSDTEATQKAEEPEKNEAVQSYAHEHSMKEKEQKSMFSNILEKLKTDDYILIALILVFLLDDKNENDFLIPILLGIILLF